MHDNPYESPEVVFERAPIVDVVAGGGECRVEGKFLVVRSGAVLPPVCVKSNQPVWPEDVRAKRFDWCSPLVAIVFVVAGPLIGIIAYFVARKRCKIAFGLHPTLRRKYRNRLLVKWCIVLTLLVVMVGALIMDYPVVALGALVQLLVALIVLLFGNSPISVQKHRKGEFWFRGCSPAFLATLEAWPTRS